MKRTLYIVMIGVLAAGMLTVSNGKAEAMNPEAALLIAGGIALFGGAMLHAAVPAPVYAEAYPPAYYGHSYRPVMSSVVYVEPAYRHHRHHRYCDHDPGWRYEQRRHRYDSWR